MKCFVLNCGFVINDVIHLLSNYRNIHSLCSGLELECDTKGCPRIFLSFQRLKNHKHSPSCARHEQ